MTLDHNMDSPLTYILTQLLLWPVLLSCIVIKAEQGKRSLNSEHPVLDTRSETNADPLFPTNKDYCTEILLHQTKKKYIYIYILIKMTLQC